MATREMTVEEHIQTALTFLKQSEQEFEAGDILQGSEKLWGAVAHATIAVAKQRGWPTNSHRNLVDAARNLSEERDDESLFLRFQITQEFHWRFYGHGVFHPFAGDADPMENSRATASDYVHRVLDIANEAP